MCAFGAEFTPIRARLESLQRIRTDAFRGCYGNLGGKEIALVETGIGVRRSRQTARKALEVISGVDVAILTGVAGALAGDLKTGQIVLATKVMMRGEDEAGLAQIIDTSPDWFEVFSAALNSAKIGFTVGPILTSSRTLATAAEKNLAAKQTGAIAVDMESASIALEMTQRGLPFVCVRAILDSATQDVVGARLADEEGNVRTGAAVRALLTNPAMVVGVYRLLRDLKFAANSLSYVLAEALRQIG